MAALDLSSLAASMRPELEVPFDFRGGRVDPKLLPARALRQHFAQAFGDAALAGLANEVDPLGWPALRQHIAGSLLARGLRCSANQVVVTSGAQAGLDLIARVLVEPGDVVAMEEPGYFGARLAFRAAEAEVLGVPVDSQGLVVDVLARLLRRRRIKLLYVTPAVQSPTGARLSAARREALLALAAEHQVPILEDDYDNELRHSEEPVTALASHTGPASVLYVGTFSKALFPALRLGYVVVPEELTPTVAAAQLVAQFAPSAMMQSGLCSLLTDESLARHVRRVRAVYAERIERLLAKASTSFPSGTELRRPAGGNQVWVRLPRSVDGSHLHARALEEGIAYAPGKLFFCGTPSYDALSLSVARIDGDTLEEGIARLGALAESLCTT
jgi:DNA-binding transcriptional MocR family regulator